jgi:hypothetical protein
VGSQFVDYPGFLVEEKQADQNHDNHEIGQENLAYIPFDVPVVVLKFLGVALSILGHMLIIK